MAGQTIQVSVLADTRRFSRAMRGLSQQTGLSKMGDTFKRAGKKVVGFLKGAAKATVALGVALAAYSLKKGFDRLNSIDEATKKLSGLGHSAKDVDRIMSDSLKSVKGTAFGLDEAATTAATVVASGVKPGKQLQTVLGTVADTATIAGTSMGDMGQIFSKVAARGKVQTVDLQQMAAHGVPALQFLAKHYHTTAAKAQDMVTSGEVSFKDFAAAMKENVSGAALKSGATVKGAFANLKASLGRIGAGMLSGVFPKIAPLLQGITTKLGPLEDKAAAVGKALGGWIATSVVPWVTGTLVPAISSLWGWVHTRLWPALRDLGSQLQGAFLTAFQSVAGAFKDTGTSAGGLAKSIGDKLIGAIKILGPILAGVVTTAGKLLAFMIRNKDAIIPLAVAIGTAVAGWKAYRKTVAIAKAAQLAFNAVAAANPLGVVLVAVAALTAGLVYFFTKTDTGRKVWAALQAKVKAVVGWFTGTAWPNIRRFFGAIASGFASLRDKFSAGWAKIKGFFSGSWSWIRTNTIDRMIHFFKVTIPGAFDTLKAKVSAGWDAVVGIFGSAWSRISGKLSDLKNKITGWASHSIDWLKSAGRNIIGGLKNGIGAAMAAIKDWLKAHVFGPLVNGVKSLFGIHSPSTVFAGLGGFLIKGLLKGMISGNPAKIVGKVFGGVTGTAKKALGWLLDHGVIDIGKLALGGLEKLGGLGSKLLGKLFGSPGKGSGAQKWANTAKAAMAAAGLPQRYLGLLLQRMQVESGGNPNAINLWDSNAKAGIPSQGLMQVVPPTFAAYAGKYRSRGIRDPFANIYAAIMYSLARYGLAGLVRAWSPSNRNGYATGVGSAKGGYAWVGENGRELMRIRPGDQIINNKKSERIASQAGGRPINITINGVDTNNAGEVARALTFELKRQRFAGKYAGV